MREFHIKLLVTVLLFWGLLTLSEEGLAAGPESPVRIAVGFSLEPYMLKQGKGIIGDVITESFLDAGLSVEFSFHTNREAIDLFNEGEVDGVSVVGEGMVEGKYSLPVVTFTNHVISLAVNGLKVVKLEDLKNCRIVAFSSAREYLGPLFHQIADQAVSYQEIPSQELQVKMLFDGEAEVIIADKTIFEFYRKKLRNQAPQDKKWGQEIAFNFAFPDNVYHVAFHTELQQKAFDRGLEKLQSTGRYQQIVNTYLGLLKQY